MYMSPLDPIRFMLHPREPGTKRKTFLLSIASWLFDKDPDNETVPTKVGSIIPNLIKQPVIYPKW